MQFTNILVTGGFGFIGSNFIKKIATNKNYKILNIDKVSNVSMPENLSYLKKNKKYKFIKCDIKNKQKVNEIINSFKPKIVAHFAAESHVDNSIKKPDEFINSNIIGTFNLISACNNLWSDKKKYDTSRFLHVSTDEVYGSLKIKDPPFEEKSQYQPNSPYASSKASSDFLVRAWNKTYGFKSIITSCSNNYGPMQHPEKLIPKIILNAISKKKIPIYGNGKNVRDWIHVSDHIDALIKVLKNGNVGEKYNIGGNNELNNITIAKLICNYFNKNYDKSFDHLKLINYVDDRLGHDFRYAINDKKIRKNLNFRNKKNFKQGIQNTIKWYIENSNFLKKKFGIK